jgi:hypothetical protein
MDRHNLNEGFEEGLAKVANSLKEKITGQKERSLTGRGAKAGASIGGIGGTVAGALAGKGGNAKTRAIMAGIGGLAGAAQGALSGGITGHAMNYT